MEMAMAILMSTPYVIIVLGLWALGITIKKRLKKKKGPKLTLIQGGKYEEGSYGCIQNNKPD